MKKNITINLCGRLFQIDEDAYEMLQHYVDSLRSHFGRETEGEEIVNDIEERIAELFDELKAKGSAAITIDHVKDIITRIGKPEQLAGETEETHERNTQENQHHGTTNKRLFRNPNDKMVAGVLSGLAAYTNTDVLFWRLGTVLFTFFYGSGLLLYIILAIIMPEARTPEELLLMQGKEVNPKNLADMVVDGRQPQPNPKSGLREIFSVLLNIVIGFFVVIAALVCIALCIAFLGVLMTVIFALVMPARSAIELPFTLGGMGLIEVWNDHPAVLIAFALSLLAVLFIPVYAIIHFILCRFYGRVFPMSMTQRIVWIALWLVAICALIPLGSSVSMLHDQYRYERNAERNQWMTDEDREYLNANGWKLQRNSNCHNDYVKYGEYFTGDKETAYLDVWDLRAEQVFQVASRKIEVDSGTYRITCNARAQGKGVFIYAKTPADRHEPSAMTMIPVYGNEGGQIWEKAAAQMESDSLPIAERARNIRGANDGKGYGWSTVELIVNVDRPHTTLCYGVSNWEETTKTPNKAQWFSACDFKIERVEDLQQTEK